MKKKTKQAKRKRTRLDGLIATAPTQQKKMLLAFYGVTAAERNQWPVRVAKAFWHLKQTENDKLTDEPIGASLIDGKVTAIHTNRTMRETLYQLAKNDLEVFTLAALWQWRPEWLEELAKAMRRVGRGEFDCQFGTADAMARAAIILDPKANIAELGKQFFPKQEAESRERNLKRIRARILRPDK